MIECYSCKKWCHQQCSDLTNIQFDCLQNGGDFILWMCYSCRGSKSSIQDRVEAKLDSVLKILSHLTSRMDALEEIKESYSPARLESIISKKVEEKVEEHFEEIQEKEKRKLNLIISNLPESSALNSEERKEEDLRKIKGIIKDIKTEDSINIDELNNPVRLGPIKIGQNKYPRLLRVTVKSEENKMKIVRNSRTMNKEIPPAKRIYINEDCTPKEREKQKKLRDELKLRRDGGEQDLYINYKLGVVMVRKKDHGPVSGDKINHQPPPSK